MNFLFLKNNNSDDKDLNDYMYEITYFLHYYIHSMFLKTNVLFKYIILFELLKSVNLYIINIYSLFYLFQNIIIAKHIIISMQMF